MIRLQRLQPAYFTFETQVTVLSMMQEKARKNNLMVADLRVWVGSRISLVFGKVK